MQKVSKLTLAALALAASASLTVAQEQTTPPLHRQQAPRHGNARVAEGQRQHGPPLVAALDANRDDTIDATELANAPAGLRALDKNDDGKLDATELGPGLVHTPRLPHVPPPPAVTADGESDGNDLAHPAPPPPPPPPHAPAVPKLVAALDVNQDGVIDADEIANATAALKVLDKNADGQLTPDEYRPAPPAHAPGHPGQRGPGAMRHMPTPPPDQSTAPENQ